MLAKIVTKLKGHRHHEIFKTSYTHRIQDNHVRNNNQTCNINEVVEYKSLSVHKVTGQFVITVVSQVLGCVLHLTNKIKLQHGAVMLLAFHKSVFQILLIRQGSQ